MRLDKFISHTTSHSRSASRSLIKNGLVLVNQHIVVNPGHITSSTDIIILDGETLQFPAPTYIMLHKPAGYVCSHEDSQNQTVFDLLKEYEHKSLSVAGRLDVDTTGLVLISDDGQWIHRIISPRTHCPKMYIVTPETPLTDDDINAFEQGLLLRNEDKPTKPAQVQLLPNNQVRLTISEGRYHQIKRMFAARNNRVLKLHRQTIGSLELDPQLAPGEYRVLNPSETEMF